MNIQVTGGRGWWAGAPPKKKVTRGSSKGSTAGLIDYW